MSRIFRPLMVIFSRQLCRYTAALVFFSVIILTLSSCRHAPKTEQGYIEGNLIYIASTQSGQLTKLTVKRGDWVKKGQLLGQIEQQPYLANMQAAQAAMSVADANLHDLLTGKRPAELAQITAQIRQAQAQVTYTKQQLARNLYLTQHDNASEQSLDAAQQDAEVALQRVVALQQSLISAQLPARIQHIRAAKASLTEATAQLRSAQWTLQQTLIKAPVNGKVVDNYYWPGEQIPVQQPVISLLVPQQMHVVFYLPETLLSQIKTGQYIHFNADGNQKTGAAQIDFISPNAEYTPPVIYSLKTQQKFVYRIEAHFSDNHAALTWHPGQLVTVTLPRVITVKQQHVHE